MGADVASHAPASATSATGTAPGDGSMPGIPPLVRPPDDRAKRKRNLVIIVAVLLALVVATAVEVGVPLPDMPVASNVVIALFNLNLIRPSS